MYTFLSGPEVISVVVFVVEKCELYKWTTRECRSVILYPPSLKQVVDELLFIDRIICWQHGIFALQNEIELKCRIFLLLIKGELVMLAFTISTTVLCI